jgi:hypothetical protein
MFGEEIDPDALVEAAKQVCKEVKDAMDKGEIGRDKDKTSWERFFLRVTKAKGEVGEPARHPPKTK